MTMTTQAWSARAMNLARTGATALQLSPLSAGVFVGLVAITVGAGIWQQHLARPPLPQTSGFTPAAQRAAQFSQRSSPSGVSPFPSQ